MSEIKSDFEKYCVKLNKNLAFRMSLGGKELFHSNMLQWILTSDDISMKYKNNILKLFIDEENLEIYDVLREKFNFDLIIVLNKSSKVQEEDVSNENIAQKFLFIVIENKFKSLPEKEQLERYNEKIENSIAICEYIEKENINIILTSENTQKILLSPKVNLELSTRDIGWKKVSYEELKEKLKEYKSIKNDFFKKYLKSYVDFLTNMLELSKFAAKDAKNVFPNLEFKKIAKGIRINDFYEKIWINHRLLKINKYLDNKNIEYDYSSFGYSRENGFMEWKIKYKNLLLGVQIQGKQFRVSVEPNYGWKYREKKSATRDKAINEWVCNILNRIEVTNIFVLSENNKICEPDGTICSFNDYKYRYGKLRDDIKDQDYKNAIGSALVKIRCCRKTKLNESVFNCEEI